MSVNHQSLEISGILPSSEGVQEDQHLPESEYDSSDSDGYERSHTNEADKVRSELNTTRKHQHPNILAQRNQSNVVEPTIIPTDYNSFTLSTAVVCR